MTLDVAALHIMDLSFQALVQGKRMGKHSRGGVNFRGLNPGQAQRMGLC